MGHRDNLLVTLNLSGSNNHDCRPHPRGSVRRASGFVLTGNPEVMHLLVVSNQATTLKIIRTRGACEPYRGMHQLPSQSREDSPLVFAAIPSGRRYNPAWASQRFSLELR